MVEIDSDVLEMDVIHDIEDAIEGLHVKLVNILAKHENRKTFLQLVIVQEQHQQHSLSIENP